MPFSDPLSLQALALSKNRAAKRAMEVAQSARVTELERANTELRAELEQAWLKIAEVEERQDSLCSDYQKLENECESLHNAAETLKRQKAEAEKTGEAEVATIHTRFQDYRVHHRKKLHDLRFNLEKAVNEFGASCLPYPGKGSTIDDIIRWFDEEIKALPAMFMKANKNFACYAIVGILRMLYDSGCDHLSELQTLMPLCDASLLEGLPPKLSKLIGRLVQKWLAEHGLPKAARRLRRELEVIISSVLCDALVFCVLTSILLIHLLGS
jgi:hypothetical protein